VLGVLVITSEYSTGSIQTSLAAVPRRGRFLAAKATVLTAVSLITGEATALTVFLLGQALISAPALTRTHRILTSQNAPADFSGR
jgi:ABC-2 type transport system permease protein